MAWARMDDGFHDHPKVGRLSLSAVGLWTLCFTWANRHLGANDLPPGSVPRHLPKRFGGNTKQIRELVEAGLWTETPDGWLFHDFEEYLPESRRPTNMADVSAARSEAGRKGAAKRWHPDGNLPSELPSDLDGKRIAPGPSRTHKGGGPSRNVAPDPWCDLHPGGTDTPCAPCGRARRAHDTWQRPTPTPPSVAELRRTGAIRT